MLPRLPPGLCQARTQEAGPARWPAAGSASSFAKGDADLFGAGSAVLVRLLALCRGLLPGAAARSYGILQPQPLRDLALPCLRAKRAATHGGPADRLQFRL